MLHTKIVDSKKEKILHSNAEKLYQLKKEFFSQPLKKVITVR